MKYSKYYGSEYAPDPFFCIEVLEKQIATLTADKRILKAAIEYYKDDVVVMKARIERLETEMKEKDAIISTRTEMVHQLQDALSCGHSPFESTVCGKCGYPDPIKVISALTAKNERLKEACKRVLLRQPIGGLVEDVLLEDDDLKLIQAALAGEEE